MGHRHAWRTGCRDTQQIDVPVEGGTAEILLLSPHGPWHGTVLAVHGYACNRTIPHLVIYREFLKRGLGIASVPLPGHHAKSPPLHAERLLSYLPEVLQGLRPHLPAPLRLVLGNSLGSVMLLLAMPHLGGLEGGILLQPPLRLDWSYRATLYDFSTSFNHRLLWAMRHYPWSSAFAFLFGRQRFWDPSGNHRRYSVLHPGMMPRLNAMFEHVNLSDRLKQVKAPGFLLVTGEKDPVAPPRDVQAIAEMVGGQPDFRVIPGTNHTTLFFVPSLPQLVSEYLDQRLKR